MRNYDDDKARIRRKNIKNNNEQKNNSIQNNPKNTNKQTSMTRQQTKINRSTTSKEQNNKNYSTDERRPSNHKSRSSNTNRPIKKPINKANNNKKNTNIEKTNISRQKRRKINRKKLTKKLFTYALILLVIIAVMGTAFVYSSLRNTAEITPTTVREKYISTKVVNMDDIPKNLKNAVVAIEDENFYKHNGVKYITLVKCVVLNLFDGGKRGGSTIEMQVSKNLFTTHDQTIRRKIRDIYNAIQMDKTMGKQDILDAYLNNIYLGKSAIGVQSGAQVYFHKDVNELNLAECAALAGMTQNPAKYSTSYENMKIRKDIVLGKMKELGYINEKEYNEALNYPLIFDQYHPNK